MRKEIRISGFGGQGIITAGIILAKAAALEGFEVLQTQSYGSEARGGACKADVTISDSAINDLSVERADILLCMSNVALAKHLPFLKHGGGILVINSDLVKTDFHGGETKKIPATSIGGRSANMAMVAAVASIAKLASLESLETAIRDTLQNPGEAIKAAKAAYKNNF